MASTNYQYATLKKNTIYEHNLRVGKSYPLLFACWNSHWHTIADRLTTYASSSFVFLSSSLNVTYDVEKTSKHNDMSKPLNHNSKHDVTYLLDCNMSVVLSFMKKKD